MVHGIADAGWVGALDAGFCILAAVDFLRGDAMEPEDQQKAWKEGWIWVRG